jgi:hypothetical protein
MDIKSYIDKKESEAKRELSRLADVRSLLEKYPDLELHVNRWNQERLMSSLVVATDVDIGHNCGCCADSPVEVWPFTKEGETKIYVKGIPFIVGEKNSYEYGEVAYEAWDKKLREKGLSEELIKQVASYLGVEDGNT